MSTIEGEERKKLKLQEKPIWQSPAWLTAIVAVISAFLTVPEIIGDYLAKQQDIELAKEKTKSIQIGNIDSKQKQEFDIVNSTLAQQGEERVFVLRYLASTLDDPDAKEWAEGEVARLDDLASLQEALEKARVEFTQKERDLIRRINKGNENRESLKKELANLRSELSRKDSEVSEIKKKAGIKNTVDKTPILIFKIKWTMNKNDSEDPGLPRSITLNSDSGKFIEACRIYKGYCEMYWRTEAPSRFSLLYDSDIKDLLGKISLEDLSNSIDLGVEGLGSEIESISDLADLGIDLAEIRIASKRREQKAVREINVDVYQLSMDQSSPSGLSSKDISYVCLPTNLGVNCLKSTTLL